MTEVTSIKYMLAVQDMDRALTFWRDTFNLEVKESSSRWSELAWGDAIIALHGGGDGSDQDTELAIEVRDIKAAVDEARAAGGRILVEPRERPGEGIMLADLRDPEGNYFTLSQRL